MADRRISSPITFGRRLSRFEVAGVIITETEHQPGRRLDFHEHAAPNLNFVIGGSHVETFRSRTVHCLPGSIVVKPAGALHANAYGDAGSRSLVFEFKTAANEVYAGWSPAFREIRWLPGGVPSAYAWQIRKEGQSQLPGWRIRVEELLLHICDEVSPLTTRGKADWPSWVNTVRDFLESNYDTELSVSEVARICDVHPVYLTRVFRKRFGCTVAQFLRRKRLDRAIQEITSTSKSMAEIAADCGFYDQSHLTNLLRQTAHVSPAALRSIASL